MTNQVQNPTVNVVNYNAGLGWGNTIEIKGVSVQYDLGANADISPVPGLFSPVKINIGSTENANIVISGIVNKKTSADMTNLNYIRQMVKTKGVKLFYYPVSESDNSQYITAAFGEVDTLNSIPVYHNSGMLGSTVKHIHVRVIGFSVTQSADSNFLSFRITCTETA